MSRLEEVASNPKVAATVAAATTTTGASTWFEWIPANIGWVGSLIGALLGLTLIVTHTIRIVIDIKKAALDNKIKQAQLKKELSD